MRSAIAISVLALALAACSQTSATDALDRGTAATASSAVSDATQSPGPTAGPTAEQTAEQTAQLSRSGTAVDIPPEVAAWSGSGFFPNEFCWKINSWPRSMPRYWEIRYWCERPDRDRTIWEPN